MTMTIMRDGVPITLTDTDAAALFPAAAPSQPTPRTIFTPREIIETLFTPAEQQALYTAAMSPSTWQVAKFISLVTATPQVDITDPEFVADIRAVEALGLLTADRVAAILGGTTPSA